VVWALDRLNRPDSEVHVLVTDDRRIQELNRQYRQVDRPTDVLSFPDGSELPSGRILLGQLVVSLETARTQAECEGHSPIRELEELLLHGVLHLVGFDHSEDQGEMDELELQMRRELPE
jgi:probable rRNA maturation factor